MRIGLWVVVPLLFVVGAVVALVLLRPATAITSTVDPDVTIECTGAVGIDSDGCHQGGDAILAEGSPTTTFEAEDVVRLRLDRALFGFGETCRAEWFLGRYPDDVAWSEPVACPGG